MLHIFIGILAVLLCGQSAMAADGKEDGMWFVDLVRGNFGKVFCSPSKTTILELLTTVKEYVDASPDMSDKVTSYDALKILAIKFPCPQESADQAPPPPAEQAHSVRSITPIFSQLFLFPLPNGFKPVFENVLGEHYILEFVLEGESEKKWTQMITVTGAKGVTPLPGMSPYKFAEVMAGGYMSACPKSFTASGFTEKKIGNFDSYSLIVSCGTSPASGGQNSESALVTVIKGEADYYTIEWAERAKPANAPLAIDWSLWIRRLQQIMPVKLCRIVPGEAAPYPSCVNEG